MGVRERRSRRERGGKEKKVLTERRESLFVSHSTTNANQDMPLIKKKDFSIPLIPLLQQQGKAAPFLSLGTKDSP